MTLSTCANVHIRIRLWQRNEAREWKRQLHFALCINGLSMHNWISNEINPITFESIAKVIIIDAMLFNAIQCDEKWLIQLKIKLLPNYWKFNGLSLSFFFFHSPCINVILININAVENCTMCNVHISNYSSATQSMQLHFSSDAFRVLHF